MNKYVLDSSAVMTMIYGEPGAEHVESIFTRSVISAINLSEAVGKLSLNGMAADEIAFKLTDLLPAVIPFDLDIAVIAGKMASLTKPYGLSLGDRACLATAVYLQMEAVTTDKAWGKLKDVAKIRVIR